MNVHYSCGGDGDGDGCGIFLACKDFWRMLEQSFLACAFFFFFFKVEISLHTLIPLFMPGYVKTGSAS